MKNTPHEKAERLFYEGNFQMQSGDFESAESSFRQSLQLCPDLSEAHANLAFILDHQGKFEEAETSYLKALDSSPNSPQVLLNLGALLTTQKRWEEALLTYAAAIRCDPNSSSAWSNLGVLHIGMKNDAEAQACLKKSLALDASNAKAKFNLSYLLLRQGQFEEGWQAFEARDWYGSMAKHFSCPRWRGESLVGQSLLIGYEAGHGDMIQFCRYIPLLKTQGAGKLTLVCHPALKRLLRTLEGCDDIFGYDENIPSAGWNYWTPLMSLPFQCQTRIDSIPASLPYLGADRALVAQWMSKIPESKLRVGLVWKGNPKFENDADRSLPHLNELTPLWGIPSVTYFALQKGTGEHEAEELPAPCQIMNLGPQVADFADAAAIVACLDLVICVDTAMAHLAGALGKPCWILLPEYMTDWRWGVEGTRSDWYPGVVRLFRQKLPGDWQPVIEQVAAALELLSGTARLSGNAVNGQSHRRPD